MTQISLGRTAIKASGRLMRMLFGLYLLIEGAMMRDAAREARFGGGNAA